MIYNFHVNVLINDGSFYYFRFCYIAFNCRGWHAVRFSHCKICFSMRFRKGCFPFLSLCVYISDGQVIALIYIRFPVSVGIFVIKHIRCHITHDRASYNRRYCYIAFNFFGRYAVFMSDFKLRFHIYTR